jgi:hypothetical protein
MILGARQGTVLYLRMVDWALERDPLAMSASDGRFRLRPYEDDEISKFSMADLEMEN